MPKEPPEIKVLPVDVASRIAAGEVIERPASALKEMLENSIDAGAERVEIDFSRGGKSYIKIADDGCGMTRSQALASLEQHATSKIADADDIFAISTYGFRGEAVPSIASVSKFTMRTRPHSAETGTRIDVEAGRVLEVRECGMPCGTEIFVEDLFCSVPARRKFLKSDNVEASHIVRLCKLYAMALPNLRLRLSEDSREIFSSEGGVGVMERIRAIYGAPMADAMIELPESRARGMSLYGAVLKPGESFATGRGISLFINSRPVDCKAAFLALKDAYAQLVPKGRYPAAFLFLDMNPRDVDVNVHPAKREVRLKDEFGVRDFILGAVSDRLARYSFELREGRAGAVSGGFGGVAAQAGGAGAGMGSHFDLAAFRTDNMNFGGEYDVTLRLPAVPAGQYEIRIGYVCNGFMSISQIYFGQDRNNMQPTGIPLDMNLIGSAPKVGMIMDVSLYDDVNFDVSGNTGGLTTITENDKAMRNQGYMKGPACVYRVDNDRVSQLSKLVNDWWYLRHIVTTQQLEEKPSYLRFRKVDERTGRLLNIDFIEIVPRSVYNGATPEDRN